MINMIQIKMGLVRLSQSKERLRQTKTFNQVTDSTNCCQSPKSRSSKPQFLSYPLFRNLNMSAKFRRNCTYTCTSDKQFVRSFVADMFSFWYFLVLTNLGKKDEHNCASAYRWLDHWRASAFWLEAARFFSPELESRRAGLPSSRCGSPRLPRRSGRTDARSGADGRKSARTQRTPKKPGPDLPAPTGTPNSLELLSLVGCCSNC